MKVAERARPAAPHRDAGGRAFRKERTSADDGIAVEQTARQSAAPTVKARGGGRTRRLRDIAAWSRQLYVLVHSGTALAQALQAVERQVPDGRWKQVLRAVRTQIDEGVSLSDAMARYPDHFDPVCRSLIAAGETSGQLDAMLERMSTLIRQQLRIRRTVTGALVYPALLIVLAFFVVVTMLLFVLPRFEGLFESLDAPMPPTTELMLSMSHGLREYWWAGLLATGMIGVAVRYLLTSAAGRIRLDHWAVELPVIGKATRSFVTARIARLLGSLVQSRVPLLDALRLTQESAGNSLYTDLLVEAEEALTRGESISTVFASTELINPSVTEALRHGEESGQVGLVLTDMADFMDEENETIVKALTTLLEPTILIVLGGIVAFVALSLFMPLFDLTAMG